MPVTIDGASGASLISSTAAPFLVGQVCFFGMSTVPNGFLKCDGSAVSRTTYAALFTAIGTTYGSGDGSTTFNVPDLRGEFIRGVDDGRGVDPSRAIGSAQAQQLGSHTHTYQRPAAASQGTTSGNSINAGTYETVNTSNPTPSSGGHGAENRPRNVALLACIKY